MCSCISCQIHISMALQVGHTLKARHKDALEYHHLMAPDSRVFDILHAMIERKVFNTIDAGRKAGEMQSLCCASPFMSVTLETQPVLSSSRETLSGWKSPRYKRYASPMSLAEDGRPEMHPV